LIDSTLTFVIGTLIPSLEQDVAFLERNASATNEGIKEDQAMLLFKIRSVLQPAVSYLSHYRSILMELPGDYVLRNVCYEWVTWLRELCPPGQQLDVYMPTPEVFAAIYQNFKDEVGFVFLLNFHKIILRFLNAGKSGKSFDRYSTKGGVSKGDHASNSRTRRISTVLAKCC
jgi:hypothetical protein